MVLTYLLMETPSLEHISMTVLVMARMYKFVNGNTLFGDFSDMSDCQLTYTVDGKKYLTQWKNGRYSSITKK